MDQLIDIERQEDSTKNIRALVYTLVISVAVILLCMFITLYQPDPLPTVKIVELELGFGNPDAGGGGGGSSAGKTNPQPIAANNPTPSNPIETREDDPKVNVPPVNNPNVTPNNNPPKTNPTKTNPTNNNTPPKLNPNASFPGMSDNGNGNGNGSGNGSGNGNGSGSGSGGGNGSGNGSGTGPGTKPGVVGDGDYNLEGRNLVSRPKIDDNISEEGKVMVNIWVDQDGNVTRATINEAQTNTNSKDLREKALKAAKKTKFSPNPGAAVEQKGLMTYKFILH